MNILYDVGARDEDENKTGFAHLFEHLMFGGSINIPNYDTPLQKAGGENNAFTNNDITNYYLTLPAVNIETGFWLESDRMLSLAFSEKSLEVQRQVVIEEFKQRYLNQPYGDVWLELRPLAYKVHPYRWNTIGKEISHIEEATMTDVKAFFDKFYHPANAILSISGAVKTQDIKRLAEKWFGPIPAKTKPIRSLLPEPLQKAPSFLEIERKVPSSYIYKVFHSAPRWSKSYYAQDLMSDILGRGTSSRLHQELVLEKEIFNDINAYMSGNLDPGLLVLSGQVKEGIDLKYAEDALSEVLLKVRKSLNEKELQKVKNKAISTYAFEQVGNAEVALNLAYWELIENAELASTEISRIEAVSIDQVITEWDTILVPENSSTLFYKAI